MKRKNFLLPIMAAVLVFCGGCSKMVTLTEQEANTIALYSAQIVSKYSRAETPGLGVPEPQEIISQENSENTNEPPNESGEETNGTSSGTGEDTNGVPGDENNPADAENEGGSPEDTDSGQEGEQISYVSMNDAIGISGLSVEYADYEMTDSVSEGSYFSLDAAEGKKFVVLSFRVENTSADTVPVNILSMSPRFYININEDIRAASEVTLLMNDFNTIDKSFAPGESMTAQLVFEVDAELEEDISSLTMDATINGENSKIKLL